MDKNDKGNLLLVKTEAGETTVEVKGETWDIITNWVLATKAVCDELNVPPYMLAAMMPGMVENATKAIERSVKIDLEAMRKAKGEGR